MIPSVIPYDSGVIPRDANDIYIRIRWLEPPFGMDVYGIRIPNKPLSNFELLDLAKQLNLNLRGVYMRNVLPPRPLENEMSIVNMNKSGQSDSHWICFFKEGDNKQ